MTTSSFKSYIEDFNTRLWRYHIKVPEDIALQYIDGKDRRIMCVINGSEPFHTGLMPLGDGIWFININKEIRKAIKIEVGDEVNVAIYKDSSRYGMPLCEEFKVSLEMDAEADKFFHQLTPGKQRNLIYIANKPKSAAIRLEKSQIILEHLRINNGKLDFKALYQALKK